MDPRRWLLLGLLVAAVIVLAVGARQDPAAPRGLRRAELAEGADRTQGYEPEPGALEAMREDASPAPAETVEPAPERGPHGRVEVDGGRGLAAIDVDLIVANGVVAWTRTARDGSFELPRPRATPAEVRVRPDPRLHLDRSTVGLSPPQARGEVELVFTGRSAGGTRFRGVMVDARTDEPLPFFRFTCADSIGTDDHVESDASGAFSTHQDYGLGRVRMWLTDFEGSLGRYGLIAYDRKSLDDLPRVPVRVGPTYRLRFQPPEGTVVTDFFAEVRGHRRAPRSYPGMFQRSRLRTGDPVWVRLHPGEVTEEPGPPWVLAVDSEDGLWSGEVAVESRVGRHPGVLPLTVESRGALRGRIEGGPAALPLSVPLLVEVATGREVWSHSDGEGGFVARGLPPGDAQLVVEVDGYEAHREALTIERGEVAQARVRLTRVPTAGAVSGTVRTDSGAPLPLSIEVARGAQSRRTWVEWSEEDGASVGRFSLELEPGDWILRAMGEAYGLRTTPEVVDVRAPRAGVELVLHDEVPRADWILHVEGPGDAKDVWARAWVRDERGRTIYEEDLSPLGPMLVDFPVDAELDWSVVAPGCRLVEGDEGAFALTANGREATARLEPGWGGVIGLIERETGRPVAGVVLALDGATVAPSDARGHVRANLAAAPNRLEVRTPGWRLTDDNRWVDPASGRFAAGDGGWSFGIHLERDR